MRINSMTTSWEMRCILYQIITTDFFKKMYWHRYREFQCGYWGLKGYMCYITEGEERNSKRTAGKLLLLEISISRNCSSEKCQNVCERLLETIAAFGVRRTMGWLLPLTVLLSFILGSSSNNDGTKESVYIRKEFNSYRICLEHQHGRHFIVWPPWRLVETFHRRLRGNWGRGSKQTVKRVINMIQFNTLIYLLTAIFRLWVKQNVNLLVTRAACGSLRWSLGRTQFFLCCPNGTINLSSLHIKFCMFWYCTCYEGVNHFLFYKYWDLSTQMTVMEKSFCF